MEESSISFYYTCDKLYRKWWSKVQSSQNESSQEQEQSDSIQPNIISSSSICMKHILFLLSCFANVKLNNFHIEFILNIGRRCSFLAFTSYFSHKFMKESFFVLRLSLMRQTVFLLGWSWLAITRFEMRWNGTLPILSDSSCWKGCKWPSKPQQNFLHPLSTNKRTTWDVPSISHRPKQRGLVIPNVWKVGRTIAILKRLKLLLLSQLSLIAKLLEKLILRPSQNTINQLITNTAFDTVYKPFLQSTLAPYVYKDGSSNTYNKADKLLNYSRWTKSKYRKVKKGYHKVQYYHICCSTGTCMTYIAVSHWTISGSNSRGGFRGLLEFLITLRYGFLPWEWLSECLAL